MRSQIKDRVGVIRDTCRGTILAGRDASNLKAPVLPGILELEPRARRDYSEQSEPFLCHAQGRNPRLFSDGIVMETSTTQTDVIIPHGVDAYWHCCFLSTTVIDKPRTTAGMSEMARDAVDPAEIESEAVFYVLANDADESANRDPRQRASLGVSRQMMSEETMRTPMSLPAERCNLTLIHSIGDSAIWRRRVQVRHLDKFRFTTVGKTPRIDSGLPS